MLKHAIVAATAAFALAASGAAFAAAPAAHQATPTAVKAEHAKKHEKKAGDSVAPAKESKK